MFQMTSEMFIFFIGGFSEIFQMTSKTFIGVECMNFLPYMCVNVYSCVGGWQYAFWAIIIFCSLNFV